MVMLHAPAQDYPLELLRFCLPELLYFGFLQKKSDYLYTF
jgi:hypothetical protein